MIVADWPRPDIGRPWDGEECIAEMVLVGAVVHADQIVDPGRVYTPEEWRLVRAEVEPFIRQRMAMLMASTDTPN